jgi:hypothetical protein
MEENLKQYFGLIFEFWDKDFDHQIMKQKFPLEKLTVDPNFKG